MILEKDWDLQQNEPVARDLPMTQLYVQYQTLSDAAEANNYVIHEDELRSHFYTENHSQFLVSRRHRLPLSLAAKNIA